MARAGILRPLRHRDYRLVLTAFGISDAGTWAYNVALTVWLYQATGSAAWVTAGTVCRLVPAMLISPYAGVVADRFEKVRLMVVTNVVFAGVMAVLGLLVATDAPPLPVLAVSAVSTVLGTVYTPAAAGVTPYLVPESDLAAANALRATLDDITVIAGPAVAALLLIVAPPEVAVWVNGSTFVVAALLMLRVRMRSAPADVTHGGTQGPMSQALVGFRTILGSAQAATLVAFSVLATFGYGGDLVLYVVMSDDLLGTGSQGYGYLFVGLGLGSILAAPWVTRAESRSRLAPVILGGMAVYTLPTLFVLLWPTPEVAFVVQVVRGAGTLAVDILAVTALQRSLERQTLARVFGAFSSLMMVAVLIGSSAASLALGHLGTRAGLVLITLVLAGLSVAGAPALARLDARAAGRRAAQQSRIEALEASRLFVDVSDGGLSQLAAAADEVRLAAGHRVVVQGAESDALYVVLAGRLAVSGRTDDGHEITAPELLPGDVFGEIGLLSGRPRTATVTVVEDVLLLRVGAAAFADALTVLRPSDALLDGAAARLERTHPGRLISVG